MGSERRGEGAESNILNIGGVKGLRGEELRG